MEAHWFINALGEGVARGMNFYGDRGVYSWDGGTVNSGVIRRGSWDELALRSYRIADWIRKAVVYEFLFPIGRQSGKWIKLPGKLHSYSFP